MCSSDLSGCLLLEQWGVSSQLVSAIRQSELIDEDAPMDDLSRILVAALQWYKGHGMP